MLKHLISISALVVVASGACFDNGDKEIGGACYKFVAQKLSFNDARDWCHYKNPVTASYLAHVPNQFTANFLASYARSAFGQNDGYFWIGLSRTKNWTPWTWDTGYAAAFTNFNSDQLTQNWAAESVVNTKWSTFGEEEKMNFVCSYDPTEPPTFAPPTSAGPTTTPRPTSRPITTQSVPTTTDSTFCQFPKWSFTFFLAYSRQLSSRQYNETVKIVTEALRNYPYQDNVLRNAYLDYEENEVIGLPRDLNEFTTNILSSPPNPLSTRLNSSNLITIIQNFIPTAQETSEYSGKTTNWLENSILLLLPGFLPNVADRDLPADNYTSFINRNVKVFIVMSIAEVKAEEERYDADLKIFSNLATRTNGHWIIVSDADYGKVLDEIMDFGYGKDLLFTRNVGNISGTRELGLLRTPGSLINVTITITESIVSKYPAFLPELRIRIKDSNGGFDKDINMTDYRHKMSNFYLTTIQLPSESIYSLSVTYIPPTTASRDLLIRIWTDRVFYQYSEFVDLSFYPTDPNDKDGAAMRMTVLNNCYQQDRADIVITDCTGLESKKYDTEQVSGIPIGTEGSYPKFAFVPYFCDVQGSDGCVEGSEGKYDVQLTVGTYSISRSFQCLPGSQPFNPKCTQKDSNGNYYCTRDTIPYKRGPTGQLIDCIGRGHLEFDSEVAEDYVCICDKGWGGESCQKAL